MSTRPDVMPQSYVDALSRLQEHGPQLPFDALFATFEQKPVAAASLAQAGGLLFNVAALPGASFILIAGIAVLGFLLSLGLPHLLVPRNLRGPAVATT